MDWEVRAIETQWYNPVHITPSANERALESVPILFEPRATNTVTVGWFYIGRSRPGFFCTAEHAYSPTEVKWWCYVTTPRSVIEPYKCDLCGHEDCDGHYGEGFQ